MKKKLAVFSIMALIHFGLSIAIVWIAMSVALGRSAEQLSPNISIHLLVAATKILHFPIITLSLYSRHWFPGNWIYILILINSFLWSGVICGLIVMGGKMLKRN
jgi:hypothetical protein